jgi:hypothetical protein
MLQRIPTARPTAWPRHGLRRGPAIRPGIRPRRLVPRIGGTIVISCCLLAFGLPALAQATKGDAAASQKKGQPLLPVQIRYSTDNLPRPVLDLREALTAAVESGKIEELTQTYAESHVKPDIGAAAGTDPAAHWKRLSGDGLGREVLAALSLILEAGYTEIRRGADIENNKLYVWPYFAETPLSKLTPRQEVELLRLVPASVAREMKEKGKYTHWRLVIGADGTWHALRKGD